MAEEALKLLQAGGVDLSGVQHINGETTGVALIAVAADGENLIVVCPGANKALRPADVAGHAITHMMGVLEISADTLLAAAEAATGFVSLNLAPAMAVPGALLARASLLCVNETEAAFYGDALHAHGALVAVSRGGDGAALYPAAGPGCRHGRRRRHIHCRPDRRPDRRHAGARRPALCGDGRRTCLHPPRRPAEPAAACRS